MVKRKFEQQNIMIIVVYTHKRNLKYGFEGCYWLLNGFDPRNNSISLSLEVVIRTERLKI